MAARSTKKKSKPTPKSGARRRPAGIAVGDEVRAPIEATSQYRANEPRSGPERKGESIEGLVCSVREISSGKLVAKAEGSLEGFVLEVLHDRTFHPQFSSTRNTGGPRGPVEVHRNPNWLRVKDTLQKMAGRGELVSLSARGGTAEPFASLLDGWRVVKLRANAAELL